VPWRTSPAAGRRGARAGDLLLAPVRYVALNPCRAGLARDPLEWPWSTHRDVVGAVADPWVAAEQLATMLQRPRRGFAETHHAYVSADPDVAVGGTPLLRPVPRTLAPETSLTAVSRAAASATRATSVDVRRPGPTRALFIRLASSQGWQDSRQLAEVCGTTPWTIRWHRRTPDEALLAPGLLCLGDRRLLRTDVPALLRRAS
jgi:hypothetical protein